MEWRSRQEGEGRKWRLITKLSCIYLSVFFSFYIVSCKRVMNLLSPFWPSKNISVTPPPPDHLLYCQCFILSRCTATFPMTAWTLSPFSLSHVYIFVLNFRRPVPLFFLYSHTVGPFFPLQGKGWQSEVHLQSLHMHTVFYPQSVFICHHILYFLKCGDSFLSRLAWCLWYGDLRM